MIRSFLRQVYSELTSLWFNASNVTIIYSGYDATYSYTVLQDEWFSIYIEAGSGSSVVLKLNGITVDGVDGDNHRHLIPLKAGTIVSFDQAGSTGHAAMLAALY